MTKSGADSFLPQIYTTLLSATLSETDFIYTGANFKLDSLSNKMLSAAVEKDSKCL